MPGVDYGPLSQGSRRYFRAISPISQPQDSRGAAPTHTPGLRSRLRSRLAAAHGSKKRDRPPPTRLRAGASRCIDGLPFLDTA